MLSFLRSTPAAFPAFLLVVLALLPYVHARRDMAKFFNAGTYYFPDRVSADNGCKERVQVLEAAYAEAAILADDAVNALTILRAPRPQRYGDPKGFRRWVAKSNTMSAFFKIDLDPVKGGPVAANRADFDNVEKLFKLIQYGFENDNAPGQTPAMYCGTKAWKFIKPDGPDPNNAGSPLKARKNAAGKEEFPDGIWHFNRHFKKAEKPLTAGADIGLCLNKKKKRLIAVTSTDLDIITWCPLAFDTSVGNGGLATKLPATIAAGDTLLTETTRITLSWTFLHELAHFHGARPNIGLGGPKVIDQLVDWPQQPPSKLFDEVAAYGAPRVLKLANDKDANTATHNADTYGTFAVAMHYPDFDWSNGGIPAAI